jgi:hypothetical protein
MSKRFKEALYVDDLTGDKRVFNGLHYGKIRSKNGRLFPYFEPLDSLNRLLELSEEPGRSVMLSEYAIASRMKGGGIKIERREIEGEFEIGELKAERNYSILSKSEAESLMKEIQNKQ